MSFGLLTEIPCLFSRSPDLPDSSPRLLGYMVHATSTTARVQLRPEPRRLSPLAPDQPYQLTLSPLSKVTFLAPPSRKGHGEQPYAGLVLVRVDTPGVYRVSLDQPVWVDVVVNGAVVAPQDHQGRPGCNAPHKIVEFSLPGGTPVTLQLSGEVPTVKVTVSRSPGP